MTQLLLNISWQKFKKTVNDFNLFSSIPPTNDQHKLRNQRISTRLFIIFLALSLAILLLYTSLIDITQTVNIKSPTNQQYSNLYSTYSQTLKCDCAQISISYDKFLHIDYTFHQICNSVYVSQNWIDYLFTIRQYANWYSDDFRWTSTSTFQALRAFCDLVNQTIGNHLSEFYSSQFVSASVVPTETFELQADSFITQLISTMANDFFLSLLTIRQMTQSDAIYSAQETNYGLNRYSVGSANGYTYAYWYDNDTCSCSTSAKCSYQSRMYSSSKNDVTFYIPGMQIGCYIVESLLQSDLRCFYNQTCITKVESYFEGASPMNVTSLDQALLKTFSINSTVEDILNS
ncbi:unnamed protein product, partial [Adineta steineri]